MKIIQVVHTTSFCCVLEGNNSDWVNVNFI